MLHFILSMFMDFLFYFSSFLFYFSSSTNITYDILAGRSTPTNDRQQNI